MGVENKSLPPFRQSTEISKICFDYIPATLITKRTNNTANARLILAPEQTDDELKLFRKLGKNELSFEW